MREDVLGTFARSEIGDQAVFAGGFFRWLYPTGIPWTPTFLSQIYVTADEKLQVLAMMVDPRWS